MTIQFILKSSRTLGYNQPLVFALHVTAYLTACQHLCSVQAYDEELQVPREIMKKRGVCLCVA